MHEPLGRAVGEVRRRWRLRVGLRGLAVALLCLIAVVLVSLWGMDQARFAPAIVLVFRVVVYGSVLVLAWRFLLLPLRRRVSSSQVALYIEEHAPSLSGQVSGAVEFGGGSHPDTSPVFVERLVDRALEHIRAADGPRIIERPRVSRALAILGAAAVVIALIAWRPPGFVSRGAGFLVPISGAAAVRPYRIDVTPGDTAVPRGADLRISATLHNFTADPVVLVVRRGKSDWQRFDMVRSDSSAPPSLVLFNLDSTTTFAIEAAGIRSDEHTVTVRDLPYVRTIAIEYHYPAYTELPPQRQDSSGDVAALPGTRVQVSVTPTMAVREGALVIDAHDTIALAPGPAGTMRGTFVVRKEGTYRVHLAGAGQPLQPASSDYEIALLEDHPPVVTIPRPGRDLGVTSIEEVFAELKAEDDYGVKTLDLVYSINGTPEQTRHLYAGAIRKEALAGHTFFLEEMGLHPGDFVSFYARAADARPGSEPTTSDIYFLNIRPFDHTYREAGQGGMPSGEASVGQLSERQRQIIAGTFNLVRDRSHYGESEYRQNLATLALSQGRLREEVATLAERLVSRGVTESDSMLKEVATILPLAVTEMRAAEEQLGRRDPQAALPPEQRALQHLQHAETIFRREQQIARGQPGQGGGGQRGDAELSDLFQLDLDRLRSPYEQVQRGQRQQAQRAVDSTLERLRELARRQQRENEQREARARQDGGQNQNQGQVGASGSGSSQRQLADEAADLARRLERLTREQSQPELADAARRLQQAADAMRRAAADPRGAQGQSALDQLRDAQRRLEQGRSAGLARDARELADRARRLAGQERDVAGEVGRLAQDDSAARGARVRQIQGGKAQMANDVAGLQADADRLARDARSNGQPDAGRRLGDAASAMRDRRIEDKIRFSRSIVQGSNSEYARSFEEVIGSDLADAQQRLEQAAGAVGESREQRIGRAVDRTRDVANALETLRQRAGQQGDRRQLRGELNRQRAALDSVRGQLGRDGENTQRLGDILNAMGRLDNRVAAGDSAALAQLQQSVVEGLKDFEFAVRRRLAEKESRDPQVPASSDVAPEYRRMVDDYYRALAGHRN